MSKKVIALALAGLTVLSACGGSDRGVWPIDVSDRFGKATDQKGANHAVPWSNPKYNTSEYEPNNYGAEKRGAKPPVDYLGQHWIDPDTQCLYSRAGRPTEVSWHLVLNPVGLPVASPKCQREFVTVPYSGPHKWVRTGKNTWTSM